MLESQDKSKLSHLPFLARYQDDTGSIAAEYLLVIAIFWFALLPVFFLPDSAANGNYGLLGNAVVSRYRLMLYVVSLPFP
jgi:hypothetical protein